MNLKQRLQFQLRIADYIDRRRFFGWFLALAIPWVITMSLFVQWHNRISGSTRASFLSLPMIVGLAGAALIQVIFYFKVIRPAALEAQRQLSESKNARSQAPISDEQDRHL